MGVFAPRKSTATASSTSFTSNNKLKLKMTTRNSPSVTAASDEREEGEIIDEFEDIISSDEEISMRQRIEELEAKNAELEKIANISGGYGSGNYDYVKKDSSSHLSDRYPLISIDISDDEDYPPAPPMSRIAKRRKSLQQSLPRRKMLHTSSNNHRRRKKSSSPPPAPQYRPCDKLLLSMFHDRVTSHSSHSSKRKRKSKKSHSTKSSRRKSREFYHSDSNDGYNFDSYNVDAEDSYENFNSADADRSFSINREELRFALARNTHRNEQHVSLKDRLIRRKENTDTLNEKTTPDPQEEVEEEKTEIEEKSENEDNLEEQELRIIALKSAVMRKHLDRKKRNENVAYSPSDFDEIYANMAGSPSINNIDDAEACNSMEISPVPSPKMILTDDEGIDTKPVDMDIANSDSDCELPSCETWETWVPIEQIPLPNNMGMAREELYTQIPLIINDGVLHRATIPPEVRFESVSASPGNLDSEVEEEELALRALLLAKMNSPKVNKIAKEEPPKVEEIRTSDLDISLEAETLRNFLISNMKKKTEASHSPASVLKEAVRRLTARNSSPAENFTEMKIETPFKTIEQTEKELGQAITEMARVQIGVKRLVEPKEVEKPEVLSGVVPVGNACREISVGKGEREIIVKKENLSAKRNTLESRSDVEHKEIIKKAVLEVRGQIKPKASANEKAPDEMGPKKTNSVSKKVPKSKGSVTEGPKKSIVKDLPESGANVEAKSAMRKVLDPKTTVKRVVPLTKNQVKPKETVTSRIKSDVDPEMIVKCEVLEDEIAAEPNEIGRKKVIAVEGAVEPNAIVKIESQDEVETRRDDVEFDKLTGTHSLTGSTEELAENKALEEVEVVDAICQTDVVSNKPDVSELNEKKVCPEQSSHNKDIKVEEENTPCEEKALNSISAPEKELALEAIAETSEPNKHITTVFQTEAVEETTSNTAVEPSQPSVKVEKVVDQVVEVPNEMLVENNVQSSPQDNSKAASSIVEETKIELISVKPQKAVEIATQPLAIAVPKVVKTKESNTIIKPVAKKLVPSPQKSLPALKAIQKPVPKLTTQPVATRTKIVKPNKVINQPTRELKRKVVDSAVKPSIPVKKIKTEETMNRLITAAEMPQVKKLVIQLRASDTESEYSAMSGEEYDYEDDSRASSFLNQSITIGNEYYDIASPISLPMESPCETPTRSASPAVNVTPTPQSVVEKSIVNDFFEAKLDQFLKNVRSKVADSVKKPVVDDQPVVAPVINTPVAVRHLPEASQQEYRRLINRMKMLERQKQAKNLKVIVNTANGTAAAAPEVDKTTLVRKVLVKNATAKPTSEKKVTIPSTNHVPQKPKTPEKVTTLSPQKLNQSPSKEAVPAPTEPSKENLLVLYENSYHRTGTSIISNLDKSIELVRVVREAKMVKLKHEHRLRELQKEMDEVTRNIKQQQEQITKIYPQICSSHRTIESLKARRGKINKAVTALGRSAIGSTYSMNNDQKPIISEKSKKLAAEIKFVNNMKLSDVEKWESEKNSNSQNDATTVADSKDLNSCLTMKLSPAINTEIDVLSSKNDTPIGNSENPNTTEDIEKTEPDLNDTIVPEALANKDDPNDSTNGHEEALETETIVDDKQTVDPQNEGTIREEEENAQMGGAKLQDYVSPLSHLRDDERQINPNGIVCPYQLMGQCDDKDCKYMHLDE